MRFCAGVTKVRDPVDGTISGKQFPLWNYFRKTVITIEDAIKLRHQQIEEVKKAGKKETWVESNRTPDVFYLDDDVDKVKQIAKQSKGKLNSIGIITVRQLCEMTQTRIEQLDSDKEFKMSKKLLQQLQHNAQLSLDCDAPSSVDHRLANNH